MRNAVLKLAAAAALALAILAAALGTATGKQSDPSDSDPASLDTPGARAAWAEAREQEQRRRAHRDSADGRDERARSKHAFRNQPDDQALAIARKKFPRLVAAPPLEWPELGAGRKIDRYLSGNRALVTEPGGERSVIESTLPLSGETPEGDRKPLDMALTEVGGSYAPKSSAAAVRIPKRSRAALRFLGQDFGIVLDGARDSDAKLSSNKAFYANALTDTDLVVEPVPLGAEISLVLRSPVSPSKPALSFELPPDARLRLSSRSDSGPAPGSAEVVRDGKRLALIPPALAVDAQGESVPVSYSVDGDRLVMEVDTGGEIAWPVALDPTTYVYDNNGQSTCPPGGPLPCTPRPVGYDWPGWFPWSNRSQASPCPSSGSQWFHECRPADGALYVYGFTGFNYAANDRALWQKNARPGTYIFRLDAANMSHTANTSQRFAGICGTGCAAWSSSGQWFSNDPNSWGSLPYRYNGSSEISRYEYFCVDSSHGQACTPQQAAGDSSVLNNAAVFGIAMNGGYASSQPSAAMGGAATYSSDNVAPNLTVTDHDPDLPPGWVEGYNGTARLKAVDGAGANNGMGMGSLSLAGGIGQPSLTTCTTTNAYDSCPTTWEPTGITYTTALNEGTQNYTASATDIVGNRNTAQDKSWSVKVDRTPPGAYTADRGRWVNDGVHQLPATASDTYSGMRQSRIWVARASDRFERTTSNGWGTADQGGAWTVDEGPASDFSTSASNGGKISFPAGGGFRSASLYGRQIKNADVSARIKLGQPTTGTGVGSFAHLMLRRQPNGGDNYRVGLVGTNDGRLLVRGSRNAGTLIDQDTGLGFTPGNSYRLRVVALSDSATTTMIYVKYWRDGDPEPAAWDVTTAPDSAGPQVAGATGVRVNGGSTTAQQFYFDEIKLVDRDATQTKDGTKPDGTTCDAVSGCPQSLTHTYSVDTAGYAEGPIELIGTTNDPLFGAPNTAVNRHQRWDDWQLKLDRTAPTIDAAPSPNPPHPNFRPGDTYSFTVDSSDNLSGVEKIDLYVNGVLTPPAAQGDNCSSAGCDTNPPAKSMSYTIPANYSGTDVTFKVIATDKAGNPSAQHVWRVHTDDDPPTAPVISGPLRSAQGKAVAGTVFGLHVEAEDGTDALPSSGVRQTKLFAGTDVGSMTERLASPTQDCPSGNCTQTWDTAFSPAAGDQSRTPRRLRVQAADQAGNTSSDRPGNPAPAARWRLNDTVGTIAADSVPRSEQVTNTSFETDTSGWANVGAFFLGSSTFTRVADSGAPHGGYVAKVVAPEWHRGIGTDVTVTAGTPYRVRVKLKREPGGQEIRIGLGEIASPNEELVVASNATPSTTGYSDYTGVVVPNRSGNYRLYIRAANYGGPQTTFYVDSVSIKVDHGGVYAGGYTQDGPGATTDGDKAVALDGTNGRIGTYYKPFSNGTAHTFEGWAKRTDTSGTHTLVGGTASTRAPILYLPQGSKDVVWYSDVGLGSVRWPDAGPTGAWFHWAFVFDEAADSAELFVNGVSRGVVTVTEPYNATPGNMSIGAYAGGSNGFKGSLDDVAVYPRALTATEVARLHSPDPYESKVAHWRLNESTGTTAVDSAPHQQQVGNTSFESDTSGWTTSGPFFSGTSTLTRVADGAAPDGAYAAKVDAPEASRGIGQDVILTAGRRYRVRVKLKREPGSQQIRIGLGEIASPNEELVIASNAAPGSTAYTEYTGVATPSRTGKYRLYIRAANIGGPASTFYVDAVTLTEDNAGTYTGGYTLNEPGATADGDKAVKLNGSSGYVTVPDARSLDLGDSLSVEAWFKRSSTTGNQILVGKGQNAYILWITGGKLTLRKSHVGNIVQSDITPGVDGQWHHVVATKDGPTAKIYLDGLDVSGPVTNQTLANNSEPLNIGTNTIADVEKWNGWVDDVALYSAALSGPEVARLYEQHVYDWRVVFDNGAPTLDPPTLSPSASVWVNGTAQLEATLAANDSISGIKSFKLFTAKQGGGEDLQTKSFDDCSVQVGNLCDTSRPHTFTYTAATMPEGSAQRVRAIAEDAVANQSTERTWDVKIDRTAPALTLSDELKDADGGPVYNEPLNLHIDARDGDTSSAATTRSGVERQKIWVDRSGPSDPPDSQNSHICNASCPDRLEGDFVLNPQNYSAGQHVITVQALDKVGNVSEQTITVTVQNDTVDPVLQLSGGLYSLNPTGRDLHAHATDGGPGDPQSGVKSIELRIDKNGDGDVVDSNEQEGFVSQPRCNSCPLDLDYQLPVGFSEGAHKAQVRVLDHAGNETIKRWTFYVVNTLPGSRSRLGLEDWFEYDSTDAGGDSRVHVNAETGNTVWHSVPIVNPGRGLSTFVNLTYNSLDRGGILGSTIGRIPIVDTSGLNLSQELPGMAYAEAGMGFSISVSGPTRVNEPLGGVELAAIKSYLKRTGQIGTNEDWIAYLQANHDIPVSDSTPLGDQVTLTDADGTVHTFQRGSDGKWIPPAGLDMNLREWDDGPAELPNLPAMRLLPDEDAYKWAMTRSDGVTHFFDVLGYQRATKDRNGNMLRYEYERYDTLTGDGTDTNPSHPCAIRAIGEATNGVYCALRLKRVVDPAGVQAEPDVPGGASNRTLTIDYKPGGLLTTQQLPFESPIPFPGLLNGKAGRIDKITDHAGRKLAFEYDDDGFLQKLTEADGEPERRITKFAWEAKQEGLINDPDEDLDDGLGQDRQLKTVIEVRDANNDGTFASGEGSTDYASTEIGYEERGCSLGPLCPLIPGVLGTPRKSDRVENRRGFATTYAYRENSSELTREMDATAQLDNAATPKTALTTYRVDDRGRPIAITDPVGSRTELVWWPQNRVKQITQGAGSAEPSVSDMTYNGNGHLLTRTSWPDGFNQGTPRTVTLEYRDGPGTHISTASGSTDATGTFVSDLKTVTNPKPNTGRRFDLDARGNVTHSYDAEDNVATATYDAFGRVTHETDEAGNTTRYESFHPSGQPQRVVAPRDADTGGAGQHTTSYCYDNAGNTTRMTDPRGGSPDCTSAGDLAFSTRLGYDALNRLTTERVPLDSSGADPDTADFFSRTRSYDRNGNVTAATDGEQETTTITYTKTDEPKLVDAPGSSGREKTSHAYDGMDRLIRRTDPKGTPDSDDTSAVAAPFTTTYELDLAGRPVAEVRHSPTDDPSSLITSRSYDARGNVVGINDPRRNQGLSVSQAVSAAAPANDPRLTVRYNRVNESTAEIERPTESGSAPLIKKFAYDANGNRVSETDPRGGGSDPAAAGDPRYTSTTTYDHRNQVVERKTPTGTASGDPTYSTTQFVRRCDGKVIAETSPRGVANGTTETATDCGGKTYDVHKYFTKRITYDRNGDIASRSIPFAPGQYGRTDAQLAAWKVTYTRDRVGNPMTITDARGHSFTNAFYDTGDLRSTGRPSWWQLNWGEDQATDDPAVHFGGRGEQGDDERGGGGPGGLQADTSVPAGGPRLEERELRSANAEESEENEKLPTSTGPAGNFGEVDPEMLPDFLPKAGTTTFDYDRAIRLTGVTDVDGTTRQLAYDPAGRIEEKRWPFKPGLDIVHSYTYDAHGNVDTFENGAHAETDFDYDGYDRRVTETAEGARSLPGGPINPEVTNFVYDANGNLTTRETPRGSDTSTPTDYLFRFTPDSLDRLESETNPEGDKWTYTYDASGNRTRERSPRGNASQAPAEGREAFDTDFEFDAGDRVRTVVDGLDHTTTFEYDSDGNRKKVTAPGAATEPDGSVEPRVNEMEADGRGLPWKQTTGSGSSTRTIVREFDANGNLRRIANPKAAQDAEAKDNGSNADANLKDATLHATVRLYDEDDLLTDLYQPWGKRDDDEDDNRYTQTFARDDRGRVESIFAPHAIGDESVAQTSYDYFDTDWVESYTVEEIHDPSSTNLVQTDLVEYDYDRTGNQRTWKTRNRDDSRGRLITRTFYPNGTLEQRTATKIKEDGTEDPSTRQYHYFYNLNRSLRRMVDDDPGRTDNPERTTLIERDEAEREEVVNETWTGGKDTRFVYDEAGNVTKRQTDGRWTGTDYVDSDGGRNDAKTATFDYDVLNRETKTSVNQGGDERSVERTWWPSGEQRRKTSQKSGESDDEYVTEERWWTLHGQTSRMKRTHHGTSTDNKDLTYEYDQNGNRTKDERGDHEYNSRDQHVYWKRAKKRPDTEVTYRFTPFGAIDEKTDTALPDGKREIDYVYKGTRLDKVEEADVRSLYSYDDFGSVVKIKSELKTPNTVHPPLPSLPELPETCGELDTDGGTTRYCFDEFERMVAARGPGLNKETAVYSYDGLDRRDTKTVKDSEGGDKVRDYAYIGTSRMLSREQDRDGKTKYYDYSADGQREGQAVAPSASSTDPSTYRSYGKDANGSVEELEESDGSVEAGNEYDYDPYGDLDRAGNTASDPEDALGEDAKDNPFRYEGFYFDSGVKTYDMQARQYRPGDGMFLSQDRYASARGDLTLQSDPLTQNRYSFAGGNPVNNVEFDGHCNSICQMLGKAVRKIVSALGFRIGPPALKRLPPPRPKPVRMTPRQQRDVSARLIAEAQVFADRTCPRMDKHCGFQGHSNTMVAYYHEVGKRIPGFNEGELPPDPPTISATDGILIVGEMLLTRGRGPSKAKLGSIGARLVARAASARSAVGSLLRSLKSPNGFKNLGGIGRRFLGGRMSREEMAWTSGVLRDAGRAKGNTGLGSGTTLQADRAGRAWVGDDAILASDGRTMVSRDGLRQYRPPSYKPNLGRYQANFERRWRPQGQWQGNAHLDITDLP